MSLKTFTCEFCHQFYSSKSNLLAHQKRTKKCLSLQNKDFKELFECQKCSKVLTSKKNYNEHISKCSNTMEQKYNELETKYTIIKEKLKLKDETIKRIQEDAQKQIDSLQSQIKELQEKLTSIAEIGAKKHTYNVNNNIVNQLVPYDLNKQLISSTVNEHFSESHLCEEENGIANFAVNNLLKDKDGNYKMVCTDVARKIFIYKDDEGNIYKDVNADGFLEMYIPAVTKKSYAMISTKEEYEMLKLSECLVSIKPAIVSSKIAGKLVPKPTE
jgi:uncharacterized C2H2 Zn-finger protein